ncbi:4Fe-4S ferredoxin [Psychromonas marina]|uniref:4Fe-4S ferredoxin n=1 Tax=Psychromonas marina TaxID=88364 RepID=A0ABQ6E5P7_9GAMM|nr:4Fe-4S dicluster domain-containing protein [Psychromonas marina]GLS92525.1 4Fe-4S ferredoxin [Psychromonas marina]
MLRDIIEIDKQRCNGCGDCIPACHEGALQIIDNKAHLISDLMCDGLGACLGECPTGAMQVIQREAVAYDERQVMVNIIKGGDKVIQAHLQHLLDHNELEYYITAVTLLNEQNIAVPKCTDKEDISSVSTAPLTTTNQTANEQESELSGWPIQLHLINPTSLNFNKADLLLAADCSAFAAANFHSKYLAGKKLIIACPKLDNNQESYLEKLNLLLKFGQINSLTILRMEVPCCGGLAQLIEKAQKSAKRKMPFKQITINKNGVEL